MMVVKTFEDVVDDIKNNLLNKELDGIGSRAQKFSIVEVNDSNLTIKLATGVKKSWALATIKKVWQAMKAKPAVSVEAEMQGGGSSRNQPETILACLPYVEYLKINGKKHIAYVGHETHSFGVVHEMSDERKKECNDALKKEYVSNPWVNTIVYNTSLRSKYKYNRIVFGAPGTGKSFQLKKDCNEFIDIYGGVFERVTFYPDYTYSQFVGAYKPVMADNDHDIEYKFVQGPFLRVYLEALKSAMSDRPKPCILIIEEINRAKPASVFGDLFQLLDRDKDGVSEYEINTSEEVKRFLARELGGKKEDYSTIRLPNNMFIWATMNSADQGVYPMDTAFKRRWSFEYLGVDKNEDQMPKVEIKMGRNTSTTTDWNLLRKAINAKLSTDIKANEDKLLGPFFISKNLLETVSAPGHTMEDEDEFIEVFKSKVLMYLFEDAGRPNRPTLFEGCADALRYSSICETFDELGMGIFGKEFESKFYEPLKDK